MTDECPLNDSLTFSGDCEKKYWYNAWKKGCYYEKSAIFQDWIITFIDHCCVTAEWI